MRKRPHKVLGIEQNKDNTSSQVDPVGLVARVGLTWASLSGAQQAKLEGHAKRRLGQSAVA